MARSEVAECFFDFGEEFNFLLGNGAGEADDALAFFFVDGLGAETFEGS